MTNGEWEDAVQALGRKARETWIECKRLLDLDNGNSDELAEAESYLEEALSWIGREIDVRHAAAMKAPNAEYTSYPDAPKQPE